MWWGQDLNPGSLNQNLEHSSLSCAHRQSDADVSTEQQRALGLGVESWPCPSHGLVGLALSILACLRLPG